MRYLGIDVGSSSIKAGVLDLEAGGVHSVRSEAFPEPVKGLPEGFFEVDADEVVRRVQKLLETALKEVPDCRGILWCGQMGGILLVDHERRPMGNYLSWRDQRTTMDSEGEKGNTLSRLEERMAGELMEGIGNELKAGSATAHLFWLAENGFLPSKATAVTIGDYVVSQLCGSAPVTEYTQALGTLNLRKFHWDHELFEKLGIGGLKWPKVVGYDTPAGLYRFGGGTIPCFPVVGDHQAALLGVGLAMGELSINVSTGSQVSLLTEHLQLGEYQTRPFFDGAYLNTVTHLPAGRSLNVLVDLLNEFAEGAGVKVKDPWEVIQKSIAGEKRGDLAVNLAFFAGPMGSRGSITNISTENLHLGGLFRAAFQNMAENYARCASRISPEFTWERIAFSGGLVQKMEVLREMITAQFKMPWRVSPETEETLTGLMRLAERISGYGKAV